MIVVGAGTGGTVCGIGRKVKEVAPNCKVHMYVHILYFVLTVYSYLRIYVRTIIKLKNCLSVRLFECHVHISAVSALIEVGLAQNESCILWNHM